MYILSKFKYVYEMTSKIY